jgi:hypothetical protein
MSTARDVVEGSLRLIGALASGENATASEGADGLEALNEMIESWSLEALIIPNITREEFTLTPGTQSYTIGTGATFNTTRPIRVESVTLELVGSEEELPLKMVNSQEWAAIQLKGISSDIPLYVYFEGTYANETVNVWPKPSAAHKLVIYSQKPLASLASLNTTVTLPPGYLRALKYNLALEWAPEFGKELSPQVQRVAMEAKASIKRKNQKPYFSACDAAVLRAPHRSITDWRLDE